MVSPAAQKRLTTVLESLEKRYPALKQDLPDDFTALMLFQILELGGYEKLAHQALKTFQEEYVDWNDMRVATVREIEDLLGEKYPHYAQKADDICHLLADLYTAFRNMNLNENMVTPEGYEVMRAMPITTLIRVDMVETALFAIPKLSCVPFSPRQLELLKFLGGVEESASPAEIHELLLECDHDFLLRLSHALREHEYYLAEDTMLVEPYENQAADYKKPKVAKAKVVVPPHLEPAPEPELGPLGMDDDENEDDELDEDLSEFDDDLDDEKGSTTKRLKNVEEIVESEVAGEETKAIARVELEALQAQKAKEQERKEAKRRKAEAELAQLESLDNSEFDDASDDDLEKLADQWLAAGNALENNADKADTEDAPSAKSGETTEPTKAETRKANQVKISAQAEDSPTEEPGDTAPPAKKATATKKASTAKKATTSKKVATTKKATASKKATATKESHGNQKDSHAKKRLRQPKRQPLPRKQRRPKNQQQPRKQRLPRRP